MKVYIVYNIVDDSKHVKALYRSKKRADAFAKGYNCADKSDITKDDMCYVSVEPMEIW